VSYVVHISDGKDSQTVKDFVETLEQQNGKKDLALSRAAED
jgi:hypothetical protein